MHIYFAILIEIKPKPSTPLITFYWILCIGIIKDNNFYNKTQKKKQKKNQLYFTLFINIYIRNPIYYYVIV